MQSARELDVSVVLPFADDEEIIGSAVRRVAGHLSSLRLAHEIVAVDEGSGDNSHALLSLIRSDVPELRVVSSSGRGRGYAVGSAEARGKVLWLLDPAAALSPLAPFARAQGQVERGERDLVVVEHRFIIGYRTRVLAALQPLKGRGHVFERRLIKRARDRKLACELVAGAMTPSAQVAPRTWSRLLEVLGSARSSWS